MGTPLKLLVTVLDDRSVSRCCVMWCLLIVWWSVVIVCNRCLLSSVVVLCASGLSSETLRACDQLHLRHRSSYKVRGSIYHAYNFLLTVPSFRIERLLDPTTYIYASMLNLNSHVLHVPANLVRLCYLLAAQPLLSMHARMLTLPLLLLGLGYHLIIIIVVVDDMIIIIMLTIFDEGWKVGLSRLTFCCIRVT